ncbi:MAG: nitrous oxide-stimulated promoter family protein [Xanthomonadales bacterium]
MQGMDGLDGRLRREYRALECMTRIYCAQHHVDHRGAALCPDCAKLMQYAHRRLEKCPYGVSKPTCAKCPIHCYKPAQREAVRGIMRYAGPRMTWRHPWHALVHVFDKLRRVRQPRELRDARVARTGK